MHAVYEQGPTSVLLKCSDMDTVSLQTISEIAPAQWHNSNRAVGIPLFRPRSDSLAAPTGWQAPLDVLSSVQELNLAVNSWVL